MSIGLLLSIGISLLAFIWSVVLLKRTCNWRMGFFSIMLALMVFHQSFMLAMKFESLNLTFSGMNTEWPGLIVSFMAFLAVIFLGKILGEFKQAEEELRKSELHLRAFFRNSDVTTNIKDTDGRFVLVSRQFEKIFGISNENAHGKFPHDIYPGQFAEHVHKQDMAVLREGKLIQQEDVVPGSDPPMTLWATKFPITGESGEVMGLGTISVDISERKRIEEELRTHSQIVTNMLEGASLVRLSDDTIVYTNPTFEKMFGYMPGEMLGEKISILNAPTDKSPVEISRNIAREIEIHGKWSGEVCNIRKDGTLFWSFVNVSRFIHSEYGEVHVSVRSDITKRRQVEEQLSHQASHDSLTGLINRPEFELRANRLISTIQFDGSEHAMCFLDLDQFKVINDTCGHAAGDQLLRQLAGLLKDTVRKRDTLARLGGDEFGLLMEHCRIDQAQRVAETILRAVEDYQFFWEEKTFRIGVSIGLVAITEATGNFTELFKQADSACYIAKGQGRNRIHTYDQEDAEMVVRHGEMLWVGRINQALDDNRFCLYAQPIVALDGSNLKHYELLLRMLDEQGNIIPPGAFLPAAERYNLIEKLDTWVVKYACAYIADHPTIVEQIEFISINLSGPSLSNLNFLETIKQNLKEFGIPPGKICFEITETVAVSNLASAVNFISTLKQTGCHFALDDFGSGISSFGYLKNLPVDYLKIDGMFVKDIVDDPIDYAMVKSINEIGQVMGMQTIAEFVENEEIRDMLESIGVNYAQGYGLGKPMPIDKILHLQNPAEPR